MKHGDSASVSAVIVMWTCKDNANSASQKNWKEVVSLTISREASFNGHSNEWTFNVNKNLRAII